MAATYNNPEYTEATYAEIEDAVAAAAAGHPAGAGLYTAPSVEQAELYDRGGVPGIYAGTANGDAAYAAPSTVQVDLYGTAKGDAAYAAPSTVQANLYDRGEVPGLTMLLRWLKQRWITAFFLE